MKKLFLENEDIEKSSGAADVSGSDAEIVSDEEHDEAKADTLLTKESGTKKTKTKRKGMVKLQKILIASFAAVAVVLSVIYFAWLKPMADKLSQEEPQVPPTLIEGEAYDDSGYNIAMFPHVEMKYIKSIEVHNSYETYTCLKVEDSDSGTEFYIEEHPQTPIGKEVFTSFAVDAGYTVVNRRVTEKCEDLSLYGLAEEDNPSYYILTDTSNNVYTVYIGDRIPSGGGYYAKMKDRDAVYVLSSSVEDTVLAPSTTLMTPLLGYPVDQNSALALEDVLLYKNGQPFVFINYTPKPESEEFSISAYTMQYPANYVVNDDKYTSEMLSTFSQLSGYRVLEAGKPDSPLIDDEAKMAEYGFFDLQNMPYELYYTMEGIPSSVVAFAPSGLEGYYFAYAYLYDMIVLVETATVPYLEWDLLEFVNSALFAEYIADVKEISVTGALRQNGKTYDIDERFSISTDPETNRLTCYAHTTGKTFTGNRPVNNYIQGFYGSALAMKMQGYIKSEGVDTSKLAEYASMTVITNSDEKIEYKFYRYSERCYYTINGQGEFYLSLRDVNKLLIDAVRAAYGMYVDSKEEYPTLPEKFTD